MTFGSGVFLCWLLATSLLILVVGPFDELPIPEGRSCSDESDEVGARDSARQRCWADSIRLNSIATPAARLPALW